jgi:hypothetical protein
VTATRCRRCEFEATDDEPLAVHAIGSGHPLCIVCTRSLDSSERQVCEQCLQDTQQTLSAVVTLYGDLPNHLGHLRGWNPHSGHGSDETPLVGGTTLVLLGPGSDGGAPRRLSTREKAEPERWWVKGQQGPLSLPELMRAERERTGREHQADNLPSDAQAVSAELASWALDWATERMEDIDLGRTSTRTALNAAGYLERRMRWAATSHPAFDAFAHDMRRLLATLERAVSLEVKPGRANAECFQCGGPLVEVLREVTVTQGKVTRTGPVHDVEDGYRCRTCGEQYPPGRYTLALAEHLRANATWVPVAKAAEWARVPVDQVKKWAKRWPNPVQSCCSLTGERLVWWPDVQERADRRTA